MDSILALMREVEKVIGDDTPHLDGAFRRAQRYLSTLPVSVPTERWGNRAGERYWIIQASPGVIKLAPWHLVDMQEGLVRGTITGIDHAQAARDGLNRLHPDA